MNKVYPDAESALFDFKDGVTVLCGGFGLCGNPENLIAAVHRRDFRNLTIVSNNCGTTEHGLGILLKSKQVRKMISSYVGENKEFERQYLAGELEVELNPQGTLAERMRAGGAGLGGFFTPTGYGTKVAEGKETRVIDGKGFVFEKPLNGDFAFVKAHKGDAWGNLVFRKTARNFNPICAMAGKITIAEVEELVPVGALAPDEIHTPSIFVQRIFQGTDYKRWIEQRTTRKRT
jgi:3-oxoacid CoA-transferase subunit A